MKEESTRKTLSVQLSKKLFPLAIAIGMVITIGIPVIYYHSESLRAEKEATAYAGILAGNIRRLASEAPFLWKYQATKYAQMISEFVPQKGIRKITLLDEKKSALHQYSVEIQAKHPLGGYVIKGSPAPVMFNNQKIAEVIVYVSGYSVMVSSLFSLLICGGIGIGLALLSYRVPMKLFSVLERQLIAYQNSLEEKVGQRTIALQETMEKAISLAEQTETASRSKSEFLANMSHELRTPLNHIIGFTELVVDKNFGPLNVQQQEFLGDVLQSSRYLLGLINEILDLAKVEAGKMELAPSTVYLRPLLENSLIMIKEKALKHRIRLSTEFADQPETLLADERKLKQILYNLLSNAVKFTPDGGSVRLQVAPECGASPDRTGLRFSVIDTGVGLKTQDFKRIFEPFVQADCSNGRKSQGTGLGLTLTRKFIELHGGDIWAESEGEGKGSRFHFILPLKQDFAAERKVSFS